MTNTSNRAYPKLTDNIDVAVDFPKINLAFDAIDTDVANLLIAVGLRALATHTHAIADVPGLQTALDLKANAGAPPALAALADTAGLASPVAGHVPMWVAGAWALVKVLENAQLTGVSTAPTAAPGTNTLQIANTAFVKAAIDALVNASPSQLDTLNELAAALGNDANFAATVTAALAGKQPLSAVLTALTAIADAAAVRAGTATGTVMTPASVLGAMSWVALVDAATVAVDHAAGVNRTLTLGGNRAIAAPTNGKPGWPLNIRVKQDATGSRTLAWDTAFDFGDGAVPTLSSAANAEDLLMFVCISASKFVYLGARKRID